MAKINKTEFTHLIVEKLKVWIDPIHIKNVMMIFWEELQNELLETKKMQITNFGILVYQKFNINKYQSKYRIKFKINRKLRRFLLGNLDLDKSFDDN